MAEPAHNAGDIFAWFLEQMAGGARWLAGRVQPTLDERGAVMLLVGGLSMLALVIAMLLVRLAVAEAAPPRVVRPRSRSVRIDAPPLAEPGPLLPFQGSPEEAFRRGRGAGRRLVAGTLDATLEGFERAGAGAPRVLRILRGRAVVRLHACQGCARQPGALHGCPYEAGLVAGAFAGLWKRNVDVVETTCGGPASQICEFEVRA